MLHATKGSGADDLTDQTLHVIKFQTFPSVREMEATRAEQSCFGEKKKYSKNQVTAAAVINDTVGDCADLDLTGIPQ